MKRHRNGVKRLRGARHHLPRLHPRRPPHFRRLPGRQFRRDGSSQQELVQRLKQAQTLEQKQRLKQAQGLEQKQRLEQAQRPLLDPMS